uniref:Chaperone NapD n=1 Tax=Candidatus Kentrum sp. MB TaxID=2138164 RepID=A0A450XKN6_9GAMM|nr:MAG: periplasmic nitrate reductase chaperone NapD [Candidatus Kentron sp. MB]VFK74982.1 MAG: periplasmic nitrate reductase chaperone NapD [Candidatus Kentron sp. MB]
MDLCSILLQARPGHSTIIQSALQQLSGVELHATASDGRMVVTVEDDDPQQFNRTVLRLGEIDGVIDASLVYHYHDDNDGDGMSGEPE